MSARAVDTLERLRSLLLAEGGLIAELLTPEAPARGNGRPALDAEHGGESAGLSQGSPGRAGSSRMDPGPLVDAAPRAPGPAQIAAAGPRAAGRAEEYELVIEAIYEGYLLHYHSPRIVRPPEDDLGLLAGDRLYALGLARLVRLGDVEAVAELADVIALSALAHGAGNAELAAAVWSAGARAVGWGTSAGHERAKALIRRGSPDALAAMKGLEQA